MNILADDNKDFDPPSAFDNSSVAQAVGGAKPVQSDETLKGAQKMFSASKNLQNDLSKAYQDKLAESNAGPSELRLYQNDLSQRRPELLPGYQKPDTAKQGGIIDSTFKKNANLVADTFGRGLDVAGNAIGGVSSGVASAFKKGANELSRKGILGFVTKGLAARQAEMDYQKALEAKGEEQLGNLGDRVLYGTEGKPKETVSPTTTNPLSETAPSKPVVSQRQSEPSPSDIEAQQFNAQTEKLYDEGKLDDYLAGNIDHSGKGILRPPEQKNILGEPVQSLDEQGFYTVKGEKGATAKVLPWTASDDEALQRTLPAEQYRQLAAQQKNMRDQRALAEIESGNQEVYDKEGNLLTSESTSGGFTPNPTSIQDTSTEQQLGYAEIAQDQANNAATVEAALQKDAVKQARQSKIGALANYLSKPALTRESKKPDGTDMTDKDWEEYIHARQNSWRQLFDLDPKLATSLRQKETLI